MLINGHDLHVEQYGPESGHDVLLLHHGLGSINAWREQIPDLLAEGYHVTAYDRWGYGKSAERAGLDLPTFTEDVNDLYSIFEALEISSAAIVGHSDGGTIALYFAARYPELVKCLVIIAAHVYIEPKMDQGILGVKAAFEKDARFRKGMYYAHGSKYENVFHNWFDGWYRTEYKVWDMRPVIHKINCPALIVQGADDEHATPQHAEDIAVAIPGAELWILRDAGHMLMIDGADLFNQKLLEFLHKNGCSNINRAAESMYGE